MPPPPKALAPRPTVSPAVPDVARDQRSAKDQPKRTDRRAAPVTPLSNAAVQAAVRGGVRPGAERVPPGGQDTVGNGAVARAAESAPVAGQPQDKTAEAKPARRKGPAGDPKFASLKKDVQHKKRSVATSHPPARKEATAAQDAALPPKDDEVAQGKTANAEKMNEAKPKEFDKAAFILAVEKAIEAKAPKNLDDADKFADSGKPEEVKAEVQGRVGEGKTESAEQIATTTAAPPDTSVAVTKKVVPMEADRPPGAPGTPNPANAIPDKLPPSATDMSAGPAQVNQEMTDAQVTETQLQKSNEPTFGKALTEKQTAEQHSETAPGELRKHEAGELKQGTAQAKQQGAAAMGAMAGRRAATGQQVGTGKTGAKSRDEEKREQVTALLQKVFDATKTKVDEILNGLDKKVDDQFTEGEKQAREAFRQEHSRKMEEYKDERYSGPIGKLRWVDDLFTGLPKEADKIFDEARANYVRRMRDVISNVATTIGDELNRAKKHIAEGREAMQAEVRKLPEDLKSIGQEAAAEFSDQFEELTQSVDNKGTELVDTLATKYTETLKQVDDEIAAEKEKNKGLVAKAIDAIKSVIKTILELKRLLLAILAKAAQAVLGILKDPIGFLGNLVRAVGAGLKQFMANIGKHLQQGILSWLLGRTAEAGLQLPSKFDARGVLLMIAGLLGLTWPAIRARITRRVPEKAVAAAETAVPLVAQTRKQGVGGMWEDLKTRVGDLRKELIDKAIQYVVPTIVIAGITWVLSLLNPASAFIRAVKLIIDIVKFVVTQARQIFDFVNAVLDAVIAIAKGSGGGVPGLIERALVRAIPVLLGFLAALLGVGGIAARVKQIVQAMSRPVGRAVDAVVDKIVGLVKNLWSKIKPKPDKKKPDAKKPAKPTPGKPKRPKDRDKPRRPKPSKPKPRRTPPSQRRTPDRRRRPDRRDREDARQQQDAARRLRQAMDAAVAAVKAQGDRATLATIKQDLVRIKVRYQLRSLEVLHRDDTWLLRGAVNPREERQVPDATDEELRLIDDGKTSVDERRTLLAQARAIVRNEDAISAVFDQIRQNRPGRKKAINIFQRLVRSNLTNGYRIDIKDVLELGQGRTVKMHYFGLYLDPGAAVGGVQRKSGGQLGWAYVKAVSVPPGADPVAALAFDLFIHPSIERAKIKGVGTEMFRIAAQRFGTDFQAVVAEWGRFDFYTFGGRSDMSANLAAYIDARRTTPDPAEAVKATWTYRRAREIYGGVPLDIKVQELVPDIFNPPKNTLAVRAIIKPR